MMEPGTPIKLVQQRIANACIGNSTLRNQGASGIVSEACRFLAELNLAEVGNVTREQFVEWLDRKTNMLRQRFPEGAKDNWGAARKAINVFLEEACYNRFLAQEYSLDRLEEWLELPLDSKVVKKIKEESGIACNLTRWRGFKNLTPEQSAILQHAAEKLASKRKIPRVYLDLYYWQR